MPEPIQILIKKGQTTEGSQPGAAPNAEQGKPNIQQSAVNTALIGAGKQMMLQGIKQYGDLTGSYTAVENVSTALSIGADILMIAKGGIVGMIVVGSKYTNNIINSAIQQYNNDRENNLIRQRAGYIAVRGSRYTND